MMDVLVGSRLGHPQAAGWQALRGGGAGPDSARGFKTIDRPRFQHTASAPVKFFPFAAVDLAATDRSSQDGWSEAILIDCNDGIDGFREDLNPSYALRGSC